MSQMLKPSVEESYIFLSVTICISPLSLPNHISGVLACSSQLQ